MSYSKSFLSFLVMRFSHILRAQYSAFIPCISKSINLLNILYFVAAKSGVDPSNCVDLAKHVKLSCPNLEFSGLMTIGMLDYTSTPQNFQVIVIFNTMWRILWISGFLFVRTFPLQNNISFLAFVLFYLSLIWQLYAPRC